MSLKILQLELLRLSPENTLQQNYCTKGKTKDVLWKDIQVFSNGRKYSAAYACASALKTIAEKENKQELLRRCLLVLARLSVLLSYATAESFYKALIKEVYTDVFVYKGIYSYSLDVFKQCENNVSVFHFVFKEYLANIRKSKNKDREEILFYTLIQLHLAGENPWVSHEIDLDLSSLPVHIRDRYIEYTSDEPLFPSFSQEIDLPECHSANLHNSKQFRNALSVYRKTPNCNE
ncbi:hypothetical protein NEAUS03_1774 [Nematocida ausubeli]|nr:hypothetical protein NEAUS03_1774 [Nematocida ausubeli]